MLEVMMGIILALVAIVLVGAILLGLEEKPHVHTEAGCESKFWEL